MKLFVLLLLVQALILGAGCRQAQDPTPMPSPKSIGERVVLQGIARNAKAGAVVVEDAGRVLYVKGLDSWPGSLDGQRVKVTGVVRDEKMIPDPVVDEKGAISQGAEGSQLVIHEAEWKLDE